MTTMKGRNRKRTLLSSSLLLATNGASFLFLFIIPRQRKASSVSLLPDDGRQCGATETPFLAATRINACTVFHATRRCAGHITIPSPLICSSILSGVDILFMFPDSILARIQGKNRAAGDENNSDHSSNNASDSANKRDESLSHSISATSLHGCEMNWPPPLCSIFRGKKAAQTKDSFENKKPH